MRTTILKRIAIAVALCTVAATAHAQSTWQPTKNTELIIGTNPGGTQDRVGRMIQKAVTEGKLIPTTISVTNKDGEYQGTAIAYLNNHGGDPHFLALIGASLLSNAISTNHMETLQEFTPIIKMYDSASAYFTAPDSPIKTAQDLVDRLKADPTSVRFAMSAAPGTQNHLTVIRFAKAAGVDPKQLRIAVMSSGAEAMQAIAGGHADIGVGGFDGAMALVDAGRLRILGVLTPNRLAGKMADTPTIKEQGVDAISANWWAIVGPKGMTADQVAFWEDALKKAANTPDAAKFADKSFWSVDLTGANDFAAFLKSEEDRQRPMLEELGMVKK